MKIQVAVFTGPTDKDTCMACVRALEGNPYKMNNYPIPGDLACRNKCKHRVKLKEYDLSFMDWLLWHLIGKKDFWQPPEPDKKVHHAKVLSAIESWEQSVTEKQGPLPEENNKDGVLPPEA